MPPALEGKRAAVNFLLFGDANNAPPADAMDFFNSTQERGQPKRPA